MGVCFDDDGERTYSLSGAEQTGRALAKMTQSLDEEHLFYKGGPRAQVSLTAVLMYNSTSVLLLHSNTGLCRERRYSTDHFGTRKYSRNPVI